MIKAVSELATVLADIILNGNTWNTLYDSYLTDEEVERRKKVVPYTKTKTVLIRDWIAHLDTLKESEENKGFCAEVERLLKKTTIEFYPEFFVNYPRIEKMVSYKRSRMLTFRQFLMSYYGLGTEEAFKQFVEDVRSELLFRFTYHRFTRNAHVNKRKFAGLPVSDIDGFKEYFFKTAIGELSRLIPVYHDKGYLGNVKEFSQLPDGELEKYKLGFSYGFTLDYQDAREVIIAKFKPNSDFPATKALKQYFEEETATNYFKVMKYRNLGKLIPIFETVEDKQVMKMLILQTNF
jgi:hypothetical protein|nr:MAG TPA: hypothetical protein [Caudoviricetes sp.]